jgi:hypothetical protein
VLSEKREAGRTKGFWRRLFVCSRAGHYRNDSQRHGVFRCSYRSGGVSFCGPWSEYAQNKRARSTLSVNLTQQFSDVSGCFRWGATSRVGCQGSPRGWAGPLVRPLFRASEALALYVFS